MQTGTIVQRGNCWYLRFYEPVLIGGKTVKRQKAVKLARVSPELSNAAAVRAAGLTGPTLAPLNAGSAPGSAQPLAEFLEHVYLKHIREHNKPATIKNYRYRLQLLKPHLGALELRKTKASDIQRLLQKVADAQDRAHTTLKHVKAFLSGAFRYAILQDLVAVNPVHASKVPEGLQPGDTYAYTLEEVQKMLKVVGEPARTIMLTAALTGLRVGELQGLRWEDIKGDELHVKRSVWKGHIGETKTRSARAAVPLLPIVKKVLEEHRKRSVGEFIFTGEKSGKPLIMENLLRRSIIPSLDKTRLHWHGWHAFRRGVATNLNIVGVPDLTISRILRHGSVAITQQAYIKAVEQVSKKAMGKLARAFRQAK